MRSTPTTPPALPLPAPSCPPCNGARVKDMVVTMTTITITTVAMMAAMTIMVVAAVVATVVAVAAATLLGKATRFKAASPALPHLSGSPSTILDWDHQHIPLSNSRGGVAATLPSTAVGSCRCTWPDHGLTLHSHHPWRRSQLDRRCMPPSNSMPHLHPGHPGIAHGTSSR
jgi:hypothetical protein